MQFHVNPPKSETGNPVERHSREIMATVCAHSICCNISVFCQCVMQFLSRLKDMDADVVCQNVLREQFGVMLIFFRRIENKELLRKDQSNFR